jgi:L-asparaginase/N4-(beta-N-acetylglucosaminyl)-L-asparaginase
MTNRRQFLKMASVGPVAVAAGKPDFERAADTRSVTPSKPVIVSTWNHGLAANDAGWTVLASGGRALDAVETAVRVVEADPDVRTVGYGGLPDRTGQVTLDACIMNESGDCGSVAYLQEIMHPISVARLVMEKTPHVMLVGAGAQQYALQNGFIKQNLLTEQSKRDWEEWMRSDPAPTKADINVENHDTIGTLALDTEGRLSAACTTSGAAWKMAGRVGDSPIIGAGLYMDSDVGAAAATGWGEAVIRIVGCHLVVEFMRAGYEPEQACRKAVDRVIEKNPDYREIQVGFLALNRDGKFGAFSIQPGFNFAAYDTGGGSRLLDARSRLD